MRIVVHMTAVLDLNPDDWTEDDFGEPIDLADVPKRVAAQLSGFADNELNNSNDFHASGVVEWTSVEVRA